MTKIINAIIVTIMFLFFCSTSHAGVFNFNHTAAIIIGETRAKTLSQAEHILIKPKIIIYAFQGTSDEVEIRRYAFTQVYDLLLYFHQDIFFEAELIEPSSNTYPAMRSDYKNVQKGSPGPVGYLITKNSKTLTIQTLRNSEFQGNSGDTIRNYGK